MSGARAVESASPGGSRLGCAMEWLFPLKITAMIWGSLL